MKKHLFLLAISAVLINLIQPIAVEARGCDCSCVGSNNGTKPYQYDIKDSSLYRQLKGRIVINVEGKGEAYYIHPDKLAMIYLGVGAEAFDTLERMGRVTGRGDLGKIKAGILKPMGLDTDHDGLSDDMEEALNTDRYNFNTDGDRWSDYTEVMNGYDPNGSGRQGLNSSYADAQSGRVLVQDANKGYMWYINPADHRKYFLSRDWVDANILIERLGVGVSDYNFYRLLN